MTACRLGRPALWVSGSTHGVRRMIPTTNLASSWKTTSVCRRTPTGGCSLSIVPTVTGLTSSGHRLPAIRCRSYQKVLKVRWRLRRLTLYSCTSALERGASRRDLFTGGDFRLETHQRGRSQEFVKREKRVWDGCLPTGSRIRAPRGSYIKVLLNFGSQSPYKLKTNMDVESTNTQ